MTRGLSGIYDRARDPAAFEAARGEPTRSGFDGLRGQKYCLLVSFRRSGEPVPTPVWFGLDGEGRLFVRTGASSGKVRRIRANPRVLIAPSSVRGKPLGPLAEGRGRLLEADENARAEAAVRGNYGLGRHLYESTLGRGAGAYLEVTPV